MAHLTYEESIKSAKKIIIILGIITIGEVLFALLGKGYLKEGIEFHPVILGGVMIIMSIVKAYLIIFEFMHMKYEAPGLAKSVLFPIMLLVWGSIAFTWEGSDWFKRRDLIKTRNEQPAKDIKVGSIYDPAVTKNIG